MNMQTIFQKLRQALCAFIPARTGNVVATFALATIPIVGFVGSAIDYSRGSSMKSAMQAALDSTALMLSKDATSLTAAQLNSKAEAYFNALFTRPEGKNLSIGATYTTTDGSKLVLTGTGKMDTNFMGVLGYKQLNIDVTSTIAWGNSRMRVALALDNTGSMSSSSKMTTLKTATKSLLTQLQSAATNNGDIYVSIVPFSRDVNVGASYYNSTWVDFKDHGSWDGWDNENGTCSSSSYTTKESCTSNNRVWTPKNHNTWNGCVADRDQDYDTTVTAPDTSVQATLYPAEQYSSCPVALMPLSYDWTALKNKVDAMQPNGNTNVTIGLVWAWQTLTTDAPFAAPAKDSKYKYQDVIILLTDGENTQNRFNSSQSNIDARTKKACDNAKAAGITIYTVLVMEGTQSLLQQCASDSTKYFYLTSASQMVSAFNQIGTNLSNLRVAK